MVSKYDGSFVVNDTVGAPFGNLEEGRNDTETTSWLAALKVYFKGGSSKTNWDSYTQLESSVRGTGILNNDTPIPKAVCVAVIQKLHEGLRKYLDFKEIWPCLNRKQLLDTESQRFFVDPANNKNDKVDFLVTNLFKYPGDVLTPFVECLDESREAGVGDAHTELIEEIDKLWKIEMKKNRANSTSGRLHYFCKHRACIITAVMVIAILTVFLFGLVGTFSNIKLFQKQTSQLVEHTDSITVISLDNSINNQWVSTVTMTWNESNLDCTGNVTVIPGFRCQDSNFVLRKRGEHINQYTVPFYALPNSSVTVAIPGGDKAGNMSIRIKKSIREYSDFIDLDSKRRITEPCEPEKCYTTNKHLNSSITFNISESDFYYVFLTNSEGLNVGPYGFWIIYHYDIISFNYTAVTEYLKEHSLKPVFIGNKTPRTIRVSERFKFNQPTCNLLSYSCAPSSHYPSLVIGNAKPRSDIIVLVLLLGSCPVIFTCICLCVGRYRLLKS